MPWKVRDNIVASRCTATRPQVFTRRAPVLELRNDLLPPKASTHVLTVLEKGMESLHRLLEVSQAPYQTRGPLWHRWQARGALQLQWRACCTPLLLRLDVLTCCY